jgi:hypothetical protein
MAARVAWWRAAIAPHAARSHSAAKEPLGGERR